MSLAMQALVLCSAGLEPLRLLWELFSVAVGTFATPEWSGQRGGHWQSSGQAEKTPPEPQDGLQWEPGTGEPEEFMFFQGGGQGLQKAEGSARSHQGGLTDVFSASASLLVLGRWGVGNQAAESRDLLRTAPFPRLKAERFRRAAMRSPQLQGAPRHSAPSRSPYNLGEQPWGAGRREHLAAATCILGHCILIRTSHGALFQLGQQETPVSRARGSGEGLPSLL